MKCATTLTLSIITFISGLFSTAVASTSTTAYDGATVTVDKNHKARVEKAWYSSDSNRYLVMSKPLGTGVYIDGKRFGSTPLLIMGLPKGLVHITAKMEGYTDQDLEVLVTGKGNEKCSFYMSNRPARKVVSTKTTKHDRVARLSCGLKVARLRESQKYGYLDAQNEEVIPYIYSWATSFKNNIAYVKAGIYFGVIDTLGNYIIPLEYTYIKYNFSDTTGLILAVKDRRLTIFDKQGHKQYTTDFDYWTSLSDSTAILLGIDGRKALLSPKTKEFKWLPYSSVHKFGDNNLAIVHHAGKTGMIDKSGTEVVATKYDNIYNPSEGLIVVKSDDKFGYIDTLGREITEPIFDYASGFNHSLAVVKTNNEYLYINHSGKAAFNKTFYDATKFTDWGIASVREHLNDENRHIRSYFINTKGEPINDRRYSYIGKISENKRTPIHVNVGGKNSIYVDYLGNEIDSVKFDYATNFAHDVAVVRLENSDKQCLVDTCLRAIPNSEYDYIKGFNEAKFTVAREGKKWGFIDTSGAKVTPFDYDKIYYNDNNKYAHVKIGNKFGFTNSAGAPLSEVIYDEIYHVGESKKSHLVKCGEKYYFLDSKLKPITNHTFDAVYLCGKESNRFIVAQDGELAIFEITKGGYSKEFNISEFVEFNRRGVGLLRHYGSMKAILINDFKKILDTKSYSCSRKTESSFLKSTLTPMICVDDGEAIIIDENGEVVFGYGMKYYYIASFSDGIALVRKRDDGGDFYINEKLREPFSTSKFLRSQSFRGGYAAVQDKETKLWGIIDTKGKWVCKPKFECNIERGYFENSNKFFVVIPDEDKTPKCYEITPKGEIVE
ncbi:MAG: WG repeat-containing protein [Rikenellaceae bacterium]